VLVFGDYDVDGIAATALLSRALHRFGVKRVEFAMPDRLREGYGLMPEQVEHAKAGGFDLLITVDNGISSFAAAQRAVELGIDLSSPTTTILRAPFRRPRRWSTRNWNRPDTPRHALRRRCGTQLSTALNGTPMTLI